MPPSNWPWPGISPEAAATAPIATAAEAPSSPARTGAVPRPSAARCPPRRRAAAGVPVRAAVGASPCAAPGASGTGGAERRWRPIRVLPSPGASTGSTGAATAAQPSLRQAD
ncbi:hypothetical protein FS847_26510 [Streptomyces sp. ISID311]|nr:hypothetical protein FS847_26510 [Streptomyces sp. ISID311]